MGHCSRLLGDHLDSGQNWTSVVCSLLDWVHCQGQSPGSSITQSSILTQGQLPDVTPRIPLVSIKRYLLSWPQIWSVHIHLSALYALPHLIPKGSALLQTVFNGHLNHPGRCFQRIRSKWSELTYLSFEDWAVLMNGPRDGEFCVWKHRSTSRRITVCLWDLHE